MRVCEGEPSTDKVSAVGMTRGIGQERRDEARGCLVWVVGLVPYRVDRVYRKYPCSAWLGRCPCLGAREHE